LTTVKTWPIILDCMTTSPSTPDILTGIMERLASELCVCLPAQIESYDAATQLAKVKPLLKRPLRLPDGSDATESISIINNVPVIHPSGGGYFVHFPLAAGDPVTLVIADRSLDRWIEKGGEVDPGFTHTHELSDAFAIPGGRNKKNKLASADANKLTIGKDGDASMQITIDGSEINAGGGSNFVALSNLTTSLFTSLASAINGWTPVPNDGGAALKIALTAWLSSNKATAATKFKAL
jgi:hypothetical protein